MITFTSAKFRVKSALIRDSMKKQDHFNQNNIKFIDYKDTEILVKFLNPHARILNRRKTGLTSKNQRALANAIKRARFMGLLPYVAH